MLVRRKTLSRILGFRYPLILAAVLGLWFISDDRMNDIATGLDNRLYKHSRLEEISRLQDEFSAVYFGARKFANGDATVTREEIKRALDIAYTRVDVLSSRSYSSVVPPERAAEPLKALIDAAPRFEAAVAALQPGDPASIASLQALELRFTDSITDFGDWAYADRRKMMNSAISTDVSIVQKIREVQWEYLAIMMAFFTYIMVELIVSLWSNKSLVKLVSDKRQAMRADFLTSISNRMWFEEALGSQVKQSMFGVVYFDLDGFKKINDTLGHTVGDKLLGRVAATLQAHTRPGDIVSRFGGDEFAALVQGSKDRVSKFASRVVSDVSCGFDIDGQHVRTTSSAGVCHSSDQSPDLPVDDLMRKADLALYRAKHSGKNSVAVFSSDLLAQHERRLALEQDIVEAIERREIEVVFQPIVHLASNRTKGVEALLRWRHDIFGDVGPEEIFETAKQVGQTLPLTMLVLEHACRIRASIAFVGPDFHVAVNISPELLCGQNFAEQVTSTVRKWSVEPSQIALEVTEQAIDPDADDTVGENLQQLRTAGFPLAVDDFGSGQSNLVRLSNADFRILKLDKSLIDNVHTSRTGAQIVAAISHLAEQIGMATVAEGVETSAQLDVLRECGVTCIQGYIVSRPMSAVATLRFLVDNADGIRSLPDLKPALHAEVV